MNLLPLISLTAALQSPAPLDSVDRYVAGELERQRIPALSIAILRGDSVLLARGYGYANVEHRVPATDSTIYQSGSVGKQFAAAAVVMLSEEGRLARNHHPPSPHPHLRHSRLRRQHARLPPRLQRGRAGPAGGGPPAGVPARRALELQQHRIPAARRGYPPGHGEFLR